ncbi:doublecortin domain-containing protein 2B [Megalops cyprinoides]|uniref:doublecortin domain-containing protein 2B n=1 Tax=Megalops cyprinoides TaxID=118141 RepID=UPI001864A13B|nr:doublecortin domain-containing protein 2B [Megalops cyprinoides]
MATHGMALPPVKSVVVYRNGDPFFPGRRFVVNHRQVANLESFLNDVTQNIQAAAAVRTLYTPREGHRVHELQDLRSGAQYVAAGFEKFKKLDYLNTGLKPVVNRSDKAQARPVYRPNVSAKWRKAIHLPCIIHVFRNGDLLCPPLRFIIPRSILQDLEQILSMVSEKASLRTGAVRRLCTLEGGAVASGEELESGQYYVAVGTERFKKLPYVELLVPKAPAGHNLRNQYGNRRLPKRNETRKPVSVPQDRYSDSALLGSPESDGRRVKSTGDEAGGAAPTHGIHTKQGRLPKEEESLFYAKPVKVRKNGAGARPARPLRGDTHPSVFKGDRRKRREEVQGAEEVAEDENTAVELPVDQRVAETVEDEEFDGRNHLETPGGNTDMAHTRGNPYQEPEVGYIANGRASASSRENDDGANTAAVLLC